MDFFLCWPPYQAYCLFTLMSQNNIYLCESNPQIWSKNQYFLWSAQTPRIRQKCFSDSNSKFFSIVLCTIKKQWTVRRTWQYKFNKTAIESFRFKFYKFMDLSCRVLGFRWHNTGSDFHPKFFQLFRGLLDRVTNTSRTSVAAAARLLTGLGPSVQPAATMLGLQRDPKHYIEKMCACSETNWFNYVDC